MFKEIEKPFADDSDTDTEIDICDLPPPSMVNFLPETVNGLRTRFAELIKKVSITRKSGEKEKTGDRNELVFLLDELKRQGGIGQRSYQAYNDYLADSPPDLENEDSEEVEDQEEEDGMKKIIKGVVSHVIQHDIQELKEVLGELCGEVGEEEITALIWLVDRFFVHEFHEDGGELLPLIEERRLTLTSNSKASPSKLLHIKILIDDINSNRLRIQEIFRRINEANENENVVEI